MKAAQYFDVKVVTVPLTSDYRPDLTKYEMGVFQIICLFQSCFVKIIVLQGLGKQAENTHNICNSECI